MKKTTLFSLALAAGLATIPVAADAQATVDMTTAKASGADFTFIMNPGKVTVDWGDGQKVEITSTGEPITGQLKGTKVSVTSNNLWFLDCSGNELTELGLKDVTFLKGLYCNDNQLTSLPISACSAITDLDCSNNEIAALPLSVANKYLESLNCSNNNLNTLSLTGLPSLKTLICSDNNLGFLTLTSNTSLQTLWCENNNLTTLSLSSNRNLQSLVCDGNDITGINVANCTGLVDFWCDNNQLKNLSLSNNAGLKTLSCSNNQLQTLKVAAASANNKVLAFYCDGNNLTFSSMHSLNNVANPDNMSYGSQGIFSLTKSTINVNESFVLDGLDTNADGGYTEPEAIWKSGDVELVKGSQDDYTERNMAFTFKKPFESIYCEVTSSQYPDLVLTSSPLTVVDPNTGIEEVMASFGFSYITNNGAITMKSEKPYYVNIYSVDGKQVWSGVVSTSDVRVSLGHGIFLVNGRKISL